MKKEFDAEITIRNMHKMTKAELRSRISWLKQKVKKLEKLAKGPWLVTRKEYTNLFSFRLVR